MIIQILYKYIHIKKTDFFRVGAGSTFRSFFSPPPSHWFATRATVRCTKGGDGNQTFWSGPVAGFAVAIKHMIHAYGLGGGSTGTHLGCDVTEILHSRRFLFTITTLIHHRFGSTVHRLRISKEWEWRMGMVILMVTVTRSLKIHPPSCCRMNLYLRIWIINLLVTSRFTVNLNISSWKVSSGRLHIWLLPSPSWLFILLPLHMLRFLSNIFSCRGRAIACKKFQALTGPSENSNYDCGPGRRSKRPIFSSSRIEIAQSFQFGHRHPWQQSSSLCCNFFGEITFQFWHVLPVQAPLCCFLQPAR